MKKSKLTKWALPLGGFVALSPLAVLSATSVSEITNTRVLFDGHLFSDYDQATQYYLGKNAGNIVNERVIGDPTLAVIDPKYNMLNKNLLPTYAAQNVLPAYRMATGELTSTKGDALGSYANPGSARLLYSYPGATQAYNTVGEAKAAAIQNIFNEVLYLAEIDAPSGGKITLNPTNADDINNLKQVVWDYFRDKSLPARENNLQSGWKRTYVSGGKVVFGGNTDKLPLITLPNSSVDAEFQNFLINKLSSETGGFSGNIWQNQSQDNFVVYETPTMRVSASRTTMFKKSSEGAWTMQLKVDVKKFNNSLFEDGEMSFYEIPYINDINRAGYFTNNFFRFIKPGDTKTTYVKYTFDEDKSDGLPTLTKKIEKYLRIAPEQNGTTVYEPLAVNNINELKNLQFEVEKYYHEDMRSTRVSWRGVREGSSQQKNVMPSLLDLPETLKNNAGVLTMLGDTNFFEKIAINFDSSRLVEFQITDIKGSENAREIHHYLRPIGIDDIKLDFNLNENVVFNKYLNEFIASLALKYSNLVQVGYFYNGKLMFTQPAADALQGVGFDSTKNNLKNVSYTSGEAGAGEEALKNLWQASTFDQLVALIKTQTNLTPLAESEVVVREEDPIRQLFTFATKYKNEFDSFDKDKEKDKIAARFKWLIKYDPQVKWLSFTGATNVKLIKKYNIIVENNLNPSVTALGEKTLLLNGTQLTLTDPVSTASLNDLKLKYAPQVAQVWVFYNVQGQKIFIPSRDQADPSIYDALELMQSNIIAYESTRVHGETTGFIDNVHVYYRNSTNGALQLAINQTSEIYTLTYDKSVRYFRTYNDLVSYIKNEIVKINASLVA